MANILLWSVYPKYFVIPNTREIEESPAAFPSKFPAQGAHSSKRIVVTDNSF